MKHLSKITLTILLCCTAALLTAQNNDSIPKKNPSDSLAKETVMDFPPLNVIMDSAVKHNAMVAYRNTEVDVKTANLESQRTYWLRNLGVQADSRYGTFDNLSSSAVVGQSTTLLSSTNRQLNYGVGVYIKLPLYDVLNRKTQIKQARAEMDGAIDLAQSQTNEVRQMVIKLYEELLLKQKLAYIKSQNLGSAMVNKEMVEKQFHNGIIPVAEYVRLTDMTARIQTEYEIARSEFVQAKKMLEEVAGFSFKNPQMKETK
ncbi:MAG: TolC family protein [Bacteroidetes bacterium]|nr:TolC family protein [Bacteroidota bacterium]